VSDQPRLFPWPSQPSIGPTLDKKAIIEEVEAGLRNERGRLADAAENQSFADLDGERYTPRREAETEFDFAGRPKRDSGFMHQAVNRLCQHMYNPGPMRVAQDVPTADKILQDVYEQCHIDAVMHEAERLCTTNDVCAIEVKATNDPDNPIDLQLWGGEEFTVFLDPNDQRRAHAVVTIDMYDEQTRYRLWFPDEVLTFVTKKVQLDQAKTGVIAYQQGPAVPNTYGILPFAFIHYTAPVRRFWTPGPGTFLRRGEKRVNDRLSKLDEVIDKYCAPIGLFLNCSTEFNPEVGPGRFLRLNRGTAGYTGDGYAEQGEPDAKYLQAELAVEQVWSDVKEFMGQLAEAIDLPPSALRLDYSDAPSGISIVIRSAPLLTRARQRRPIFQWAETELAQIVCQVYGGHYDQPALVKAAKNLRMLLSWPEPRIPIPGPERDAADEWELSLGSKSRVNVIQERYGLTREQAIDHLKQVAEDEEEAKAILPQPEPPPTPDGEQLEEDADGDGAAKENPPAESSSTGGKSVP
jgi:hypothetical protein